MATCYGRLDTFSSYRDNKSGLTLEEQHALLRKSATLYVGNLSFYTTEQQIYALFSRTGTIRRIIMGLDRNNKTPCGFCFVEYYNNEDALKSLKFISGTKLDERIIRADLDPGYKDGRQYGRGRSGGQVRDEMRMDYDAGRGGYGKLAEEERTRYQEALYQDDHIGQFPRDVPAGNMAGSRMNEENPRFRSERDDEED